MQAQQRALSHQTSYATVTLTILGPKAKPVLHRQKPPPTLAGGFAAGWHALRIAVSWTLAFLGAIAPFAVVLAVAGYLVYRGRRWLGRRGRHRARLAGKLAGGGIQDRARADSACTRSASLARTSGSVSGSTP